MKIAEKIKFFSKHQQLVNTLVVKEKGLAHYKYLRVSDGKKSINIDSDIKFYLCLKNINRINEFKKGTINVPKTNFKKIESELQTLLLKEELNDFKTK